MGEVDESRIGDLLKDAWAESRPNDPEIRDVECSRKFHLRRLAALEGSAVSSRSTLEVVVSQRRNDLVSFTL